MEFIKKHRIPVFLFLLLASTYGYFYQSTQHNEAARLDQTRAILDEHRFAIDSYSFNTADVAVIRVRGIDHVFPAKAPGSSLVAIIPMIIGRWLGALADLSDWQLWHLVVYLCVLLAVSIPSALAGVAMYDIVRKILDDQWAALLAIIAIWLGTILFPFSTLYFGHAQTAALLVGSFWILFRLRQGGLDAFSRPRLMLCVAGLLAGFAVVNEYPALLIAIPLALYAASSIRRIAPKKELRLVGIFSLGAVLMGCLLMTYNYAAFGRPLFSAYQALGTNGSSFTAMGLGFAGIHWPGWHEFISVLGKILVVPQRGLLFINPVVILALIGFFLWYRQKKFRAELALIIGVTVIMILFTACYGDSIIYWGGGASTGPRQLVLILPFLALPLAFIARRWSKLTIAITLISIFFMLMATAVEPRLPYEYANPVLDFFLPHFLSGQFGLNRDALFDPVYHGLVGNATAVNFGGLIGLVGLWQLIPLLLFWGCMGVIGIRLIKPTRPRVARFILVIFLALLAGSPTLHREVLGFPDQDATGLVGSYWKNDAFDGTPTITKNEQVIDMNWRTHAPLSTLFSARWTGNIYIKHPGSYLFKLESDDGARMVLDGVVVIDDWGPHALHRAEKMAYLTTGPHAMILEYHNTSGGGSIRLSWRTPDHPEETVPAEAFLAP